MDECIKGQINEDHQKKNGQRRELVKIQGEELQRVHHLKYIGSRVEETVGMETEMSQ